jgi:hypothetical protein
MTAAVKTFVLAIASVSAAAAIGVGLADRTASPQAGLVQLDRVVVTGPRAQAPVIAHLPRVVIEGRRDGAMAATPKSTRRA